MQLYTSNIIEMLDVTFSYLGAIIIVLYERLFTHTEWLKSKLSVYCSETVLSEWFVVDFSKMPNILSD